MLGNVLRGGRKLFKALDKWLVSYLRSVLLRPRQVSGPCHLLFCVCDHFEPFRGGESRETARRAVRYWLSSYPEAVASYVDADGRVPQHTFFYPQEEYDSEIVDQLAVFCRKGLGEVEIHLHHRHDTAEGFRQKLIAFRDCLHSQHGLLGKDSRGSVRYGFIHGNWALCNSRLDGDWCGVNEELGILADTGCYADFTFPSAPSETQPRIVNAIYYAWDRPGHARGADQGQRMGLLVTPGCAARFPNPRHRGDTLLLVTGPLALNWKDRKWGVLPRVENSEISGSNPPSANRIRLWVRQHIHVDGVPQWVFVKVHTHGCVPGNADVLLGEGMRRAHTILQTEFNDGRRWMLHYVTARELYNISRAAESGAGGVPGEWRDGVVRKPEAASGVLR